MSEWHDCLKDPPPQGYKVLCVDKGDYFVAQRFRKYYFQIPFTDSRLASHNIPEKWTHIPFTNGNKGYMFLAHPEEEKPLNMDQLDEKYPEILDDLINRFLNNYK